MPSSHISSRSDALIIKYVQGRAEISLGFSQITKEERLEETVSNLTKYKIHHGYKKE